jgi:hypothetical protein
MPIQSNSSFKIDKHDATPAEWVGGQLGHNRFAKTFTGDLVGTSVVEAVMLRVENGPATYVGLERVDCTLGGRKGTFLLMHSATYNGDDRTASWKIIAGSGTGELAGIRGEAQILPNHEFVLNYELGS